MATLTRATKSDTATPAIRVDGELEDLTSSVPTPFPEITPQVDVLSHPSSLTRTRENDFPEAIPASKTMENAVEAQDESSQEHLTSQSEERVSNLLPSITQVERSCLITLNALLSNALPDFQWTPILPLRRHSMPNTPLAHTQMEADASSLLESLLGNLRTLAGEEGMIEVQNDDSSLRELRSRVDHIAGNLDSNDAQLAKSLVSLLIYAQRLTAIQPSSSQGPSNEMASEPWEFSSSIYDTLDRQVSHLKARRADEDTSALETGGSSASREQRELTFLWSKIDENLETVSRLCRQRITDADPFRDQFRDSQDIGADRLSLPPEYDPADFELPQYRMSYEYSAQSEKEREKRQKPALNDGASMISTQRLPTATVSDEKMRLDLEAVTRAIDRLYLVAPQLHNQRVELKAHKMEEMQRAASSSKKTASPHAGTSLNSAQRSRSGSSAEGPIEHKHASVGSKGKGKVGEYDELDSMLSLIGRASSRRMNDQAVVMSDETKLKLQRAKQQDDENRRKFVEQLASHSDAGRLHDQDAILPSGPRIKDPDGMLTLPEFIREAVPADVQQRTILNDPNAMLTLPEFVKESQQYSEQKSHTAVDMKRTTQSNPSNRTKQKENAGPQLKRRSKSFSSASAAGAWIIGKSWNRHLPPSPALQATSASSTASSSQAGLHVSFVAEYQETLNVVVLLFKINGELTPANQLVVEVVPSTADGPPSGDRLLIKCGASWSPPLPLPTRVLLGKHTVPLMGEHYEIKLPTPPTSLSPTIPSISSLLDASHLTSIKPSSFICASCSLPLAQNAQSSPQEITDSNIAEEPLIFRDLPSEYWTELVDAWVCHQDQKLSARIAQEAQDGFWPKKGECLVGGSYLLVDERSMIVSNLRPIDLQLTDGWTKVHCLCGASVGRTQRSPVTKKLVFRLPKFAMRPISTDSRPIRIPMSAYIVEDMVELSQAHGAYRFVICDEEEEKPRLLVWVFKPSMKLSYSTPMAALIPRSGSIVAAKILFKIIGPLGSAGFDMKTTMEKHPNFAQAEQLSYPIDICRRLAALLRESHSTYPSNRRTMSGLDAGWLQRS